MYKSHYENVPFEIPENWCWTTINDIAFVTKLAGFEYTKYIADNISKNDGIPLFKGKNVLNGEVVYEFESYIPRHISDELFRSQISKKCLLTPYVGTIGNIGIHNKEGIYHLGSNVGKIELFNGLCVNVYEEYVKFYLLSSYGYKELTKQKKATAQESISIEAIREVLIPLPPVAEQLRIVNEIDNKLSYIKEISKDCGKISELIGVAKSKILDLAISGKLVPQDPNDEPAIELLKRINPGFEPCDNSHYENLPQGWVKLRLGDVCSFERGITFPSSAKCTIKQPGMIACIRTANVQDNLELDDLWYVGNEYIKGNTEKLVRKNDIIMSSANSRELVGKVSYVHDLTEQMTFGGFVLNIRANECIFPFFLFLILRTLYLKGYYLTIATQTTNIANLNTKILGDIEVLLPPLTEQERIINSVTNILASIENITAELS